jgi:hypothetical protein
MTFHASEARRRVWGAALTIFFFVTAPMVAATFAPAQAQRSQKQPGSQQMQREHASPQGQQRGAPQSRVHSAAEFRTALEPYGRWQRHARWGEVWIPANRSRDWRPYTVGRWVYTDDWGWYWISDESEARWGWATYHYGRWVFDDDAGWCWVAGDEWSPAWVQWRRGEGDADHVGWAPLPPDEVLVAYRDEPRFWIFVRGRDFIAPRIASVILPIRQYDVFIRQTVIVNQTVVIRDGSRFAVNPGIAPSIIAKFTGRPLRIFEVRPVMLAGTAQIPGALQVRAQDVRSSNFRAQTTVRQTEKTVRAADRVQAPQPLAAERGRLGDNPPRAAQGLPSTTGQAPGAREQQPQQGQQQQQRQQQRGQQQGQQQQQEGRGKQEPAQTQGRGGAEQRQQAPTERRGAEQRERNAQPQQAPRTEGRGGVEQRQPQTERRAVERQRQPQSERADQQRQRPSSERGAASRREQQGTTGRGSDGSRQAAPQPRGQPGMTEGRGGGRGAGQAAPQGRERSSGAGGTEGRRGGGAARAAPQGGRGGSPGGATTEGRGGPGPR